ncbi:hydroxypyruvate isomerase family protein [Sulfitobacter donghicola]|uniref:Hydroxypyruvate isomerase n=1 Tax=Sulfitobacter donghicola DSW-25 = KCTC 12864 = JCM 14565 TaxID=1300350 RepID=A0A073IYN5_9RHOB|nr:TIM barrel protein [Sulfitobacter donghicola]KEJ90487.1 hydroxypyruvate isomerase [Sulfitobacter donghicola DSW-25 = KCTC 12864 = JCM 14565]KIN67727.1 Hydroxypyruvate isomerase [Sulfitobacter donghicola DSW-25 = KCTC 12864 = JCM 14565]
MKAAANLSLLWPELPYLDRFDAAAMAGFKAVEVQFPYETPAKETQRALLKNGLEMVLINAPPPNYTGGLRGFAAVEGSEDRFAYDMRRAFRYAAELRVPKIHVMSGAASGSAAKDRMITNLKAATASAPEGMSLTIEPLCPEAQPDYFLNNYDLAAEIIAAVDAPNLGLQFDSYHAQMIHGDAVAVYEKFHHLITHVQIGDAPHRNAPGCGNVAFSDLFSSMRSKGYDGWVGGEYTPDTSTEITLDWMKQL